MDIIDSVEDKNTLKLKVGSNEEPLFSLLKVYLENLADVEIVGVLREHHLVDETELLLKVKKGSPKEVLKKALKEAKKDLESKKIK